MQPPTKKPSLEFRKLMKSLTALSEYEQRLKALVALTGADDDAELIALRVLLQKLVNNTCELVSIVSTMHN